jgi:hypothetical protein
MMENVHLDCLEYATNDNEEYKRHNVIADDRTRL